MHPLTSTDGPRSDTKKSSSVRARVRHLRRSVITSLHSYRGEELGFFLSNVVVNVSNLGFFAIVGRLYLPSDYGAIAALLSIVTIANTPLNAIQAGIVHATVAAQGLVPERSLRRVAITFLLVGLAVSGLVMAASPALDHFFRLRSVMPVLMLGLWFVPSIVNSAMCGALMGRFRFRAAAEANVAGALSRIALVVVFGYLGHVFGLAGPVLATSLGLSVTAGWVLVGVWRLTGFRAGPALELHLGHTIWAFVCLGGFASYAAIDTILARHLLVESVAGSYAAAATAGKIAMFVSAAIPVIAYPRFAAHRARAREAVHELITPLVSVVVLGALTATVMALFSPTVIRVLFGDHYVGAAPLLATLAAEGAVIGVACLLTYYHVAMKSLYAAVPWCGVVTAATLAFVRPLRPHELATMMLVVACAVVIVQGIPLVTALRIARADRSTSVENA